MTSISAGHIILTPTQQKGSGRPKRDSTPGPSHRESRAVPTELPRPRDIERIYQRITQTHRQTGTKNGQIGAKTEKGTGRQRGQMREVNKTVRRGQKECVCVCVRERERDK